MSPDTLNAIKYKLVPAPHLSSESEDRFAGLRYAGAALRLVLGVTFLWAFADKLFGLGYPTKVGRGWLAGSSPTQGFLAHTTGWFAPQFQAIAGTLLIDYLFMGGLLGVGLALILGIGQKVAGWAGATMMALMYLAATVGVPGTTNPIVDEHVAYLVLFLALAFYPQAGRTIGFGGAWCDLEIVKSHAWLQ
jgi:thiosulfate dehydrogenase [quinone] large subunit